MKEEKIVAAGRAVRAVAAIPEVDGVRPDSGRLKAFSASVDSGEADS